MEYGLHWMGRRLRAYAFPIVGTAVFVCLLALLTVGGVLAHAAGTSTETTFTTPGIHTWTSPQTGTVTFDVFGAQGNEYLRRGQGLGGEARASFHVTAGQTFEILVGGSPPRDDEEKGGFNGGGRSTGFKGGGGGASDVRVGACASSKACGLEDRIVVGGGGGGAVFGGGVAGDGGGRTGANAARHEGAGGGGTQTGPGPTGGPCSSDGCDGSFGHGGNAPNFECSVDFPGGGGGWFGGGSGGGRCDIPGGGGGGGSGFISPFAVSGSFPGGHETGEGKVIVTFS
jgi:hypothetical protein